MDGSDVMGVNEVHALLDPEPLDRKGVANEALKRNAGDLVQIESEVVKIGKCECCGNPMPVVDAFKCSRVDGSGVMTSLDALLTALTPQEKWLRDVEARLAGEAAVNGGVNS